MQISPGDCGSKAATPDTIGTHRPMSQPRLSVLTLPTVVADATETSPSPRRASKSHWIFPTFEVAFPQEKEEDQKSVRFCHAACRQQSPLVEYSFGVLFWEKHTAGRLLNLL